MAALVFVTLAQYLAGYALLWSLGLPLTHATPLTVVRYAYHYGERPDVRQRLWICTAAGWAMVTVAATVAVWPQGRSLHGDARFATRREIAQAGLLGDQGIILGECGHRYLMLDGQQGVALAAPPRSGKGVGVVVPNLLAWPGSAVVVDVKRENWTLTAGYRKAMGQDVYLFDPLAPDGRTARTSFFAYVGDTPDSRIDGVHKIADRLYPEIPGVDPFWIASARGLFTGVALYVLETPSLPKTIGEVRRQGMASDDEGFAAHWRRVVEGRQRGRYPLSAECVRALYEVIDLAPTTASSIRKTFTSRLEMWGNPLLDRATTGDDFDLRDLRKRPMTIYIGVAPDNLNRLRPLLSLFCQQALGLQTLELPEHNPALKLSVLFLLDEFTALGRIPIIAEAVAYLPGYNVRILLVIQAYSQLRDVYGPEAATTMIKALAARIVFAPKDIDDAKLISEELGYTTVRVRSVSRPRWKLGSRDGHDSSVTISEQPRALLLPQEVQQFGADRAIIIYEGLRPIRAKKIRYYADPRFIRRLLPPPIQSVAPDMRALGARGDDMPIDTQAHPIESDALVAAPTVQVFRDALPEDIDRLDSLTLDDFPHRFDSVTLPEDRPPTEEELKASVDEFLNQIRSA